jgi:hypothetical protein
MASIVIQGDTSGSVTLQAPAVSGSTVITLPSTSTTLVSSQWTTTGSNIFYNTGSVGVGAAPDSTFYVGGGALGTVRFFYNGTSINYNDVDLQIWRTAAASEIMRLNSAGNLGLGVTPAPSVTIKGLQAGNAMFAGVNGGSYATANAYFDGSVWKYITSNFATLYQQSSSGGTGNHVWYLGASGTAGNSIPFTEAMTLTAAGNLLVGTTSTSDSHVLSTPLASKWALTAINSNASTPNGVLVYYAGASPNSTGREFFYATDATVLRMSVRSNGGIANYSANNVNLSDRREKTNFAPATSYLDKICAIPVQTFNYIDQNLQEDGGLTLGVVAQDVQAVAPELVMESNWANRDAEPKMRLSIYQTDLQYALMKCIQEQQALITTLTERITALEGV